MIYIYDILLNFSKNKIYDFYEWDKEDKIDHVKKIKLIKVNSKIIDDLFTYNITLLDVKKSELEKGCELFKNKQVKKAMLFTDGYRVLAVLFNDQYKSVARSKLLLEEELDVLDISEKLNEVELIYKKSTKIEEEFYTRKELEIKQKLEREIKKTYKKQEVNKLGYIYIEYFNKEEKNIEILYQNLLDSLKEINEKHIKLLDMLNKDKKQIS